MQKKSHFHCSPLFLNLCVNRHFFVSLNKFYSPILLFFNYLLLSVLISKWWQGISTFRKIYFSYLSMWPLCFQFYTIIQITTVRNSHSNIMLVNNQLLNFKLWFEHGYLPPSLRSTSCCVTTKYFSPVVC